MGIKKALEPIRYSTARIPREQKHDQWSEREWPSVAAIFESTPIGEFSTSAETVILDQMMVSYTEGTARRLERSTARLEADGIQVLGAGLLLEGNMIGTADGRPFEANAREILLLNSAQPSSLVMSETRSVQIAIPRALVEAQLGPIEALHGLVIPADEAAMLHSHLLQLNRVLRLIPSDDATRVARTLLDLLVLAVNAMEMVTTLATDKLATGVALRAFSEIRQNLGSPTLTVANLCRRLQISRSTLHRLFENDGGVQAYIRNTRLDAARLSLLDPHNNERIGAIAEQLGFSDPAHLSRLFRARFGETPSQCRARLARDAT